MKKLLLSLALFSIAFSYSQKTIVGLLSANEYTGKIISEYDGHHFWTLHNSKYRIIDAKGTVIFNDIGMKNPFQPANNLATIKKGVFTDYDKKTSAFRFVSIVNKKPLTDFVFETIIPYNNNTYFAVKKVGTAKEYVYYDENLNVLYKTSPKRIAQQLKISLSDYSRRLNFMSDETYMSHFGSFNDGLIKIYNPITKKYGFVNSKGAVVVACTYKSVGDFSEGLAFFKNDDNLYGFINTAGQEVVPAKYSKQPYSFFNNRAKVVSTAGFFGFIDSNDQLAIDAQYRFATNFYKNHALVRKEKNTPILLIDTSGKVIKEFDTSLKIFFQEQASTHQTLGLFVEYLTHTNPILKQLVDFKKGIFDKGKYNTTGVIDIHGNIVLDFKYKSLKDYNNGLLLAIFNDANNKEQQALINENGEVLLAIKQSKF